MMHRNHFVAYQHQYPDLLAYPGWDDALVSDLGYGVVAPDRCLSSRPPAFAGAVRGPRHARSKHQRKVGTASMRCGS